MPGKNSTELCSLPHFHLDGLSRYFPLIVRRKKSLERLSLRVINFWKTKTFSYVTC